jgi:hypothetical protein
MFLRRRGVCVDPPFAAATSHFHSKQAPLNKRFFLLEENPLDETLICSKKTNNGDQVEVASGVGPGSAFANRQHHGYTLAS